MEAASCAVYETARMMDGQHIWCSRDHRRLDPKDCDMCKRFHELYPMDGFADDVKMAAKYFPDAVPRI